MTHRFDTQAVNDVLSALTREMMPNRAPRHAETDTLFMGGWDVSDDDRRRMAAFGQAKNYKVVLASFGDRASDGPVDYDVVVTDGIADTLVLTNGRLWKRDQRSAAVLLFEGIGGLVKLSTKGRMLVRAMSGDYDDAGYALAANAVRTRAATIQRRPAVISTVANVPVVLGMDALAATFAAAA